MVEESSSAVDHHFVELNRISPMTMRAIYIRLLNEGVEVFRPTSAEEVGDSGFRVLATTPYDPDDEEWEFPPGSIVTCAKRKLSGGEVLVAVAAEKPM